jgi:hypothetical protein
MGYYRAFMMLCMFIIILILGGIYENTKRK